jgi:hypothetical protein
MQFLEVEKRSMGNNKGRGRRTGARGQNAVRWLIMLAILALFFYFYSQQPPRPLPPLTPSRPPGTATQPRATPQKTPQKTPTQAVIVVPGAPGALPEMSTKPRPKQITFQGCPPEGDGGDPALNRLKNRVDEGNYIPVNFDAILQLPWPQTTERQARATLSAADTAALAHYEGIPVVVVGYLFGAKLEGPESPNCHGADTNFRDHHIWFVKAPNDDRTKSIVIETTPRVRSKHPTWSTTVLNDIAKKKKRVRISGWLMFDPEHPDQVGQTRGTIWEIHPIMKIEVEQQGKWASLDSLSQ